MALADLFAPDYIGAHDTATHRICGACGELKPLSEFYKDGKDKDGNPKYRRDCINCYKTTRVHELRMKRGKNK